MPGNSPVHHVSAQEATPERSNYKAQKSRKTKRPRAGGACKQSVLVPGRLRGFRARGSVRARERVRPRSVGLVTMCSCVCCRWKETKTGRPRRNESVSHEVLPRAAGWAVRGRDSGWDRERVEGSQNESIAEYVRMCVCACASASASVVVEREEGRARGDQRRRGQPLVFSRRKG